MKPPYFITSEILFLVSEISQKIGEINSNFLIKNNPQLRKQNQIKTIHSSLSIEGNTLSIDQITAIIENKKVLGPQKDVLEVLNALKVYDNLNALKFTLEKDYLRAHSILMKGLIENPGKYRKKGVGIVRGSKVEHIAPPAENVPYLMKDLFSYLKEEKELSLIKSCVFHYEMEFIHPFADGNGRMGRLWQTLILMNEFPLFQFLPFETLISKNQTQYYLALSQSDKAGNSTPFIEYMLGIINSSLAELLTNSSKKLSQADRIHIFLEKTVESFTRKDYLKYFSTLSSATASRDLKSALDQGLIKKFGDKNLSFYKKQ